MKSLSLLALFLVVLAPNNLLVADSGEDQTDPVPVDAKAFLESNRGNYKVLKVNGEKPHDSNSLAEVAVESTEGVVTLPFCMTNGTCDPGYNFFEYSRTKVDKTEKGSVVDYRIELRDGDKVQKFLWHVEGGRVSFTNYQYPISPNQTIVLTHEIQRLGEEDIE